MENVIHISHFYLENIIILVFYLSTINIHLINLVNVYL